MKIPTAAMEFSQILCCRPSRTPQNNLKLNMTRTCTSFALLFASIIFAGCGKGNFSAKETAASKNILRYGFQANPAHVDPALVQDVQTQLITENIWQGLVKIDENNQIQPDLSTGWTVSPDGKDYTFSIRSGVTFSNGDPLTAEDFKFAIERAVSPAIHSPIAENYMAPISGVAAYGAGKAKEITGIKVLGPDKLEIDCDKPTPYLLGALDYACAFAVDHKVCPKDKEMIDPKDMIGTGPFIATSYNEDESFKMKANPNFWGEKAKIDGVTFVINKDPLSALNQFKGNEIDAFLADTATAKSAKSDPSIAPNIHKYDYASLWYLGLNAKRYPPFKDVRVRQAFVMAIDDEKIAKNVLEGLVNPATGVLPPGVPGYRESGANGLKFNVARAKQLLAAAGYPNGSGLPPLTLSFFEGRKDTRTVAQQIQSDLLTNLGVKVDVQSMDHSTWLDKENSQSNQFVIDGWVADYFDPQDFLSLLLTTSGKSNFIAFSDPQVDALCAAADVAPNGPARIKMYQDAEDRALQQGAWLPLWFDIQWMAINPRVSGLKVNAQIPLPFNTVTLK